MTEMKTIRVIQAVWYADPADAWLQVSSDAVRHLGIEDEISTDSRIDGKDVYLHEDADVALLRNAAKAKDVRIVEASKVEFSNPCPVRRMACFQAYWARDRKPEIGDMFQTAEGVDVQLVDIYRDDEAGPEVMILSPDDDPWEGMLQVPGGDAPQHLFPVIEPPAPALRR